MQKKYLEIGKIVSVHGIKGEVRVQPWCDSGEFLTEFDQLYFKKGEEKLEIESARVQKNIVIMKIKGIDDRNTAQLLRNKILYMDRDDVQLEEGSYFIQDLLGLQVIDFDHPETEYGKICDITQTGANDVYHILGRDQKVVLIPAIPDVIKEIDLENEIIKITPLKGLFDEAEEMKE